MNFGSGYAYVPEVLSDCESVDDDLIEDMAQQQPQALGELAAQGPPAPPAPQASGFGSSGGGLFASLGRGLFGRGSSSRAAAPAGPPRPPQPQRRNRQHKQKRQVHKADTNVVVIQLDTLAENADEIFAGDPEFCAECNAALNQTSKLGKKKKEKDKDNDDDDDDDDDDAKEWVCEFCAHSNTVYLQAEEVPKGDSRDYVLEPAREDKAGGEKGGDVAAATSIFVIDTSGSMCVTTEVPGDVKFRGMVEASREAFDIPAEEGFQNMHVPQGNTTWVSRLQCVQAAVDQQLDDWAKNGEARHVGLITFANEVQVIGDGAKDTVSVVGDRLHSEDALKAVGKANPVRGLISDAREELSKKLLAAQPSGPTALGPALLVAIEQAIAGKELAGGNGECSVVVCTDGLANVGLGSLDVKSDDDKAKVEKWYEDLGQHAKQHGVVVSVISIKGDECRLEDLGVVAEATGGDVVRVDPLELTRNFSSLLAKPVVATNVTCRFQLHSGLKIKGDADEDGDGDDADGAELSVVTRDIGTVHDDSEVMFEFSIRPEAREKFAHLKELPFQAQITFVKPNGMKCLRVVSATQPVTAKREEAENDARIALLAANAARRGARLARRGSFEHAHSANLGYASMMSRVAKNDDQRSVMRQWIGSTRGFDGQVQQQQQQMQSLALDLDQVQVSSDEEEDDAEGAAGASRKQARKAMKRQKKVKQLRKKAASRMRNDAQYESMSAHNKISSKGYTPRR